jgi:glycosyltransferase involved in cell wall biosynthesis
MTQGMAEQVRQATAEDAEAATAQDPASRRRRVVVATNIRFWESNGGAEARITQIVRFLSDGGCDVEVYFLGTAANVPDHFDNRIAIVRSDKRLAKLTPLQRWAARLRGLPAAVTRHWSGNGDGQGWRGMVSDLEQLAFAKYLAERRPEALFVEYIWLTRLVTALPRRLRQSIRCIVDTHDVMHLRTEQFATWNRQIYLAVDAEGERAALANFDVIVAIQHADAAVLRRLCPCMPVHVVGHAVEVKPQPAVREGTEIRFLFVGSKNHPNVDSLTGLLQEVWPALRSRHGSRVRLDIVGNIADRRAELPEGDNVAYHGVVANLDEVYRQADVVLAPVLYGTGLKIKVVEALCYGKATVTMPAGIDGMVIENAAPCAVAQDWPGYLAACERLIGDASYGVSLEQAAAGFAQANFSKKVVSESLLKVIDK